MSDYVSANNSHNNMASLSCKAPPGVVPLRFVPDQISINKNALLADVSDVAQAAGKPAGSLGRILRASPTATLALNKVLIRGPETKSMCDQLLQWTSPSAGQLGQMMVGALGWRNLVGKLPQLLFQWGPPAAAFYFPCLMKSVAITYLRFNWLGVPIRAHASLSLVEVPNFLGSIPTNPTSGGLPGRRGRVLAEGDSLPLLANEMYGDPGRWRVLAASNGVDDPLRVRPGQRVHIPHPSEFEGNEDAA